MSGFKPSECFFQTCSLLSFEKETMPRRGMNSFDWGSYVFRNPVAQSIYPFITSLDTLHEINESLPPFKKRLPTEMLLSVGEELHSPNALWEDIRSTWTPITEPFTEQSDDLVTYRDKVPLEADLIPGTTRYHGIPDTNQSHSLVQAYCDDISSADLLYRVLCYFPEIYTGLNADWSKIIWGAGIRHNQTGLLLRFSDYEAGADVRAFYDQTDVLHNPEHDNKFIRTMLDIFERDSTRLLNAFFETVNDGSRRMSYYHPAADADIPTESERYVAVPYSTRRSRINIIEMGKNNPHHKWCHDKTSPAQDASSYRSLLQNLKYDIRSRKIDHVKGTANLTTIISSALLLYRLICTYHSNNFQCPRVTKLVGGKAVPFNLLTSVWQFELVHRKTQKSVIFMDDHGLFDIRAGEMTKEEMYDVEGLVEWLCGVTCAHPNHTLAGCAFTI